MIELVAEPSVDNTYRRLEIYTDNNNNLMVRLTNPYKNPFTGDSYVTVAGENNNTETTNTNFNKDLYTFAYN